MHRRTMEPIKTMIYGLRHYDFERSQALANIMVVEFESSSDTDTLHDDSSKSDVADEAKNSMDSRKDQESAKKRRRHRQREKFRVEHFSKDILLKYEKEKHKEAHRHRAERAKIKPLEHPSQEGGYFSYKSKVYLVCNALGA